MQENTKEKFHESKIEQESSEKLGHGEIHRGSQQGHDGRPGKNDPFSMACNQPDMDDCGGFAGQSGDQGCSLAQPSGMGIDDRGMHQFDGGVGAAAPAKKEKIIENHLKPILYAYLFTASLAAKKLLKNGMAKNEITEEDAEKFIDAFIVDSRNFAVGTYVAVSSIIFLSRRIIGEQSSFGLYLSVAGVVTLAVGINVAMRHYGIKEKGENNE